MILATSDLGYILGGKLKRIDIPGILVRGRQQERQEVKEWRDKYSSDRRSWVYSDEQIIELLYRDKERPKDAAVREADELIEFIQKLQSVCDLACEYNVSEVNFSLDEAEKLAKILGRYEN